MIEVKIILYFKIKTSIFEKVDYFVRRYGQTLWHTLYHFCLCVNIPEMSGDRRSSLYLLNTNDKQLSCYILQFIMPFTTDMWYVTFGTIIFHEKPQIKR